MNGTDTRLNKTNVFILQVSLPISQGINQKYIHTFPLMVIKMYIQINLSPSPFKHAHQTNSCNNKGHEITRTWQTKKQRTKTVMLSIKSKAIQIAGGEREQRVLVYIFS